MDAATSSLDLFLHAAVLGVLFCAPPGPVFAETVHRGLRGGFVPACSVQLGSIFGDFCWALLGLGGGAALVQIPLLRLPLAILGVVLLAWLGIGTLREGLQAPPVLASAPSASAAVDRSSLLTGAGLALSNPWNVIYWTAMAGSLPAADAGFRWSVQGLFLAGFLLACVAWAVGCASLIALTRRRLPPVAWRLLNAGCGLGLLVYAVLLAQHLLHGN